jgi:hypothetical protein
MQTKSTLKGCAAFDLQLRSDVRALLPDGQTRRARSIKEREMQIAIDDDFADTLRKPNVGDPRFKLTSYYANSPAFENGRFESRSANFVTARLAPVKMQ